MDCNRQHWLTNSMEAHVCKRKRGRGKDFVSQTNYKRPKRIPSTFFFIPFSAKPSNISQAALRDTLIIESNHLSVYMFVPRFLLFTLAFTHFRTFGDSHSLAFRHKRKHRLWYFNSHFFNSKRAFDVIHKIVTCILDLFRFGFPFFPLKRLPTHIRKLCLYNVQNCNSIEHSIISHTHYN